MELEVMWDGSRSGRNGGLLCVEADAPRQPPTPTPTIEVDRSRQMFLQVAHELRYWRTRAELTAILGLSTKQLGHAFDVLDSRGVLERDKTLFGPLKYRVKAIRSAAA